MIVALFLGACSIGSDFAKPDVTYSAKWIAENAQSEKIVQDWWSVFHDPQLNTLIDDVVHYNYDLRIAATRVKEARAARGIVASDGLPQIDASSSTQRRSASENAAGGLGELAEADLADLDQDVYTAGFDASWEIDIFGGNLAKTHATDARIDVAINNRRDVMVSVLAEVARNYMELRGNQKRLNIIEHNVKLQQEILDIVKGRADIGLSRELDVMRAKSQLEQTKALVPGVRAQIRAGTYRLSVLTGKAPEALFEDLMATEPLPTEPDVIPVGLRSDLLQRRPDLRAAEANLRASLADVGAAEADLYPKFFLTGSGGFEALTFGDLLSSASSAWTLGSLIQWPIFRGGEISSEQAVLEYEHSVLKILEEVENNLTTYGEELKTRARLQDSVTAAKRSVELANGLYEQGLSNFIDVLDANSNLTQAEDVLVRSETRTLTRLIALYKSLGGGWDVFENSTDKKD
jgi:NodT family efflux transporter outer membrane factor (OMF) lipoprotein